MKKKCLSIIIAVVMVLAVMPVTSAEEVASTETAQITQIIFCQDFENYTPESSQNSVVEIGATEDKAFSLHRTDGSVDNTEKMVLDTAVSQDIVELEFNVLPRETGGEKAEAYIQLM